MICNVTTKMSLTVEAGDLDDAEELLLDLMAEVGEHPQILSEPDPQVRASRAG